MHPPTAPYTKGPPRTQVPVSIFRPIPDQQLQHQHQLVVNQMDNDNSTIPDVDNDSPLIWENMDYINVTSDLRNSRTQNGLLDKSTDVSTTLPPRTPLPSPTC
jgi:hypothetical protein